VHLPQRVMARDVPKLIRILDQAQLITALAASAGTPAWEASAEFILSNISQRMAQGLREEMQARGRVKEKDAEDAMNQIITAVRQLEAAGELVLIQDEE
ncbi:MAG: FliG C-terminal domain-containing protein, partial [Cypionkella sp.]|nr:FliG C-terminal domain-containing protein [Cypionkella sp.]